MDSFKGSTYFVQYTVDVSVCVVSFDIFAIGKNDLLKKITSLSVTV